MLNHSATSRLGRFSNGTAFGLKMQGVERGWGGGNSSLKNHQSVFIFLMFSCHFLTFELLYEHLLGASLLYLGKPAEGVNSLIQNNQLSDSVKHIFPRSRLVWLIAILFLNFS